MGPSGSNSQYQSYMQMFNGAGGMMGAGMGFGMTGDLTVGADGTIYMIRVTGAAQQSTTMPSWQI